MNEIIKKLKEVRDRIIDEKDKSLLRFFGLIARTDLENKYDLLISADWLEKSNSEKDLIYVIDSLKKEFTDDFDFLSQIVLLIPSEEFIQTLLRMLPKDVDEVSNFKLADNYELKQIYILYLNSKGLPVEGVLPVSKKDNSIKIKDF
jgi:hypothetical protein